MLLCLLWKSTVNLFYAHTPLQAPTYMKNDLTLAEPHIYPQTPQQLYFSWIKADLMGLGSYNSHSNYKSRIRVEVFYKT